MTPETHIAGGYPVKLGALTRPLRVLSLGAGVQSTALLMLILDGQIECDAAVFADTGWEPAEVYGHFEQLKVLAAMRGFPIHVVQSGNIRDTKRQRAFYDAPYFLKSRCEECAGTGVIEDGTFPVEYRGAAAPCAACNGRGVTDGMARRQCTHQLKLLPIRRKVRELMLEHGIVGTPQGSVEQLIGISLDEWQRMKPSDAKFVTSRWPLVERRWTRQDCHRYLKSIGMTAPRSACIGCPYHSNAEWRAMKLDRPDEFADAVQFEIEIQQSDAGLRGKPFLHASRVPLDQVDFSTAEDAGQLTFDAECAGICGV